MATITELKEHLEKGGKIRRPSWGKGIYIFLNYDELTEVRGFAYRTRQLLLDDWEVYEEPKNNFEITHTGLYKTRDGRRALVSFISDDNCEFYGVIDGEKHITFWYKNGNHLAGEEEPVDIVAEWEE